jgi:hypothetical protein
MFGIILIVLLAGLIFAASVRLQRPDVDPRLTILLLGSYALRLAISPLTHTANLFSSGAAGDSSGYELLGGVIARMWQYHGIHYVGGDEIPALEHTSLPFNVFACVHYLNDGPSHWGCVAIVAAAASFVCLNLNLLCVQLGASREVALRITALIAILPSFLYYTSDTYKDGFVALFALGILGCSVRLAHKFSVPQLAFAIVLMGGLWFTRFYLVFVMPAPLLLGLLGLRSGSVMRIVLAALVIGTSVTAAYAYSDVPDTMTHHAVRTFQDATSASVLNANADSGSGVTFEAESGAGAFLPKLVYTLFAPFPWQSGSIGLHIAKLEVFVWYYFLYRAMRASRTLWRDGPSNLLMFISFVVPMTVAYALSFSNIGLIVRERMNIVLATIVFASASWSARSSLAAGALSREALVRTAWPNRARRVPPTRAFPRPQW